jgi:hypothetical protein
MERMSVEIVPGESPPPPRRGRVRRTLGLLSGLLFLAGLWGRGLPAFVAWEVAGAHERCHGGGRKGAARVWSSDPLHVADWLESRGTATPLLPARAGSAELVGARYCALRDRLAAHVAYGGERGAVSVFLLPGPARIGDGWAGTSRGLHVRLVRALGRPLAVVGTSPAEVEAAALAFTATVATAPAAASAHRRRG